MEVDWRGLLTSIHVDWRDRGANCRSGNVNVACPWCQNDPSHHLAIAERHEAFYCYREPDRHSGRNFISLLVKLGIQRGEATRLLNSHRQHKQAVPTAAPIIDPAVARTGWDRFAPAGESRIALDYLRGRGVQSPLAAAASFDLRVASAGTWAWRLLIPFRAPDDSLWGWTGRAFRPSMDPKYLTQQFGDPGLIYIPNRERRDKHTLVIVEGPLDALRLAIIARRSPFIIAALTGKQVNPARLLKLRALSEGCDSVLIAMDYDVSTASSFGIISSIAGFLRMRYIGRAPLPSGYKDPAEIPEEGILPWLTASRSALLQR